MAKKIDMMIQRSLFSDNNLMVYDGSDPKQKDYIMISSNVVGLFISYNHGDEQGRTEDFRYLTFKDLVEIAQKKD